MYGNGGEGNVSYHPLSQQGDSEAQKVDPPKVTGQANIKWAHSMLEAFLLSRDGFSPMAQKHCSIGSRTSELEPDSESRGGSDFPHRVVWLKQGAWPGHSPQASSSQPASWQRAPFSQPHTAATCSWHQRRAF